MKPFSQKLDKISENIIYLLSLNSRLTVSELAKELNLSRKIIETRVNNLFRKGYIKPLAITNEKDRFRFTILIKLSKFNNENIQRLNGTKGLLKLKETLGAYDFSLLFGVHSQKERKETIDKVSNLLSSNILSFDVISHDFEDTLGFKSFCHDLKQLGNYRRLSPNKISLNEDEKLVLELLKRNPLESYVNLSKKTNMSYLKLKAIMTRLENNGLVKFSLDPDYEKLGLEYHNFFLKIKPSKKKEFEEYILKCPYIHWVKEALGRWSYVLSVTARNINEFIDITKEIRTDNKEIILDEAVLISKVKEGRRY